MLKLLKFRRKWKWDSVLPLGIFDQLNQPKVIGKINSRRKVLEKIREVYHAQAKNSALRLLMRNNLCGLMNLLDECGHKLDYTIFDMCWHDRASATLRWPTALGDVCFVIGSVDYDSKIVTDAKMPLDIHVWFRLYRNGYMTDNRLVMDFKLQNGKVLLADSNLELEAEFNLFATINERCKKIYIEQ